LEVSEWAEAGGWRQVAWVVGSRPPTRNNCLEEVGGWRQVAAGVVWRWWDVAIFCGTDRFDRFGTRPQNQRYKRFG